MLSFMSIAGAAAATLVLQGAGLQPAADPAQSGAVDAVVAADPESAVAAKPDKKARKPKKITDQNHPEFVRCRSEPVLGSRASTRRTCMTNQQWELAAREGNRNAMDMVNSGRPQQPIP